MAPFVCIAMRSERSRRLIVISGWCIVAVAGLASTLVLQKSISGAA